jgi:hypothetical protein
VRIIVIGDVASAARAVLCRDHAFKLIARSNADQEVTAACIAAASFPACPQGRPRQTGAVACNLYTASGAGQLGSIQAGRGRSKSKSHPSI